MYNETIKVANKIISYDDLFEIFSRMQEKLIHYQKITDSEEMKNKRLDYKYQNWTIKDNYSCLTFTINFYDDTQIKFDKFDKFIGIFNNRLTEIKTIYVSFSFTYSVQLEGQKSEHFSQYINAIINEDGLRLDVSLSSNDNKIEDIFDLIKQKILNAPQKYDRIIKKQGLIRTTISFAKGFIPAIVISAFLLFVPTIKELFIASYVLYPLSCLLMAFIIGGITASGKIDQLYENIIPEKKYVGYKDGALYDDDIDKYVGTSEILIGKNTHNLDSRRQITEEYIKWKKVVPIEVGIIIVVSIIILFL